MGAIHALEKLKILTYTNGKLNVDDDTGVLQLYPDVPKAGLNGIFGSFAGAITALLIGCGYQTLEIKQICSKQLYSSNTINKNGKCADILSVDETFSYNWPYEFFYRNDMRKQLS